MTQPTVTIDTTSPDTSPGHLFTPDQLLSFKSRCVEVQSIMERDYGITPAGLQVLAKLSVNIKCPEGSGAIPKLVRQGLVTYKPVPSIYHPGGSYNIPVITTKGLKLLTLARSFGW